MPGGGWSQGQGAHVAPTTHHLPGADGGLQPWVGMDPARLLNGQPCLWDPLLLGTVDLRTLTHAAGI